MEIIPAIDLLGGICVRLNQGDYNKVTEFNTDPVAQALKWQKKGATRLHVVDLDGAKTGEPINDESVRSITRALDIPVQLGGGIRTKERAEELLKYGLQKIILGTVSIEKPELVSSLSDKYPGRIIVGIDAKSGMVATRGWLEQSNVSAVELAERLSNRSIDSIIFTDIATDGTLKGPNIDATRKVAEVSSVPIIASGGVGSMSDLLSLLPLEESGVSGVIVGRAIYDKSIDLEEAIKAMKNHHIQDPPANDIFYA